jgi:hypothetical protein
MTRYLLPFDSYGLVFVGRPLWQEDGPVFCICCWPCQRSLSRVRDPCDSRPYFTVSDLRLHFSSPPTTHRVTVEVFDSASTRDDASVSDVRIFTLLPLVGVLTNGRCSCYGDRWLCSACVAVQTARLQAAVYKYRLFLLHCGSCLFDCGRFSQCCTAHLDNIIKCVYTTRHILPNYRYLWRINNKNEQIISPSCQIITLFTWWQFF